MRGCSWQRPPAQTPCPHRAGQLRSFRSFSRTAVVYPWVLGWETAEVPGWRRQNSLSRPSLGQWGVQMLCSAWQRATTRKLPGDRGDTEKALDAECCGCGRQRDGVEVKLLAYQGNVPHTVWEMTAASKEQLLTSLPKLDCLNWISTALKWATAKGDFGGWARMATCCREHLGFQGASLRWTLPPFPRMEMAPEGACCGRCNFCCWFPRDSSKFF